MSWALWWKNTCEKLMPRRRLHVIEGDSLPKRLPRRDLVLARDDGEDWCVGLRCPCGCGDILELLVVAEAKPRWEIVIDNRGKPSLSPSIWRKTGCHSHFWLSKGRVRWC
jgi:hypothetical protein